MRYSSFAIASLIHCSFISGYEYLLFCRMDSSEDTGTSPLTWPEVILYAQENLPLESQLLTNPDGFGYIKVDDQYIHTLFPLR
jgi:hypothetical protein